MAPRSQLQEIKDMLAYEAQIAHEKSNQTLKGALMPGDQGDMPGGRNMYARGRANVPKFNVRGDRAYGYMADPSDSVHEVENPAMSDARGMMAKRSKVGMGPVFDAIAYDGGDSSDPLRVNAQNGVHVRPSPAGSPIGSWNKPFTSENPDPPSDPGDASMSPNHRIRRKRM